MSAKKQFALIPLLLHVFLNFVEYRETQQLMFFVELDFSIAMASVMIQITIFVKMAHSNKVLRYVEIVLATVENFVVKE